LYKCLYNYGKSQYFNCRNDDESIEDNTNKGEFKEFIDRLESSTTKEQLNQFFDIEAYTKWQVIKYLFGCWDHRSQNHNLFLYKIPNGKWTLFYYDYGNAFGSLQAPNTNRTFYEEIVKIYHESPPLNKKLQLDDNSIEFKKYFGEIMEKAFNPVKLFPYLDKLREFLDPHIKRDRTPDKNGNLPGRFKRPFKFMEQSYTYEDFLKNSEFKTIKYKGYGNIGDRLLGLKQWILERFAFACKTYNLDCSYAKDFVKNIKYSVEPALIHNNESFGCCKGTEYNCCVHKSKPVQMNDGSFDWSIEYNEWCIKEDSCWSEKYGYPCCENKNTRLIEPYNKNKPGVEWFGVENSHWCDIRDYPYEEEKKCWSSIFGYSCCELKDHYSRNDPHSYLPNKYYSIENGQWCGIVDYNSCHTLYGYECCSDCTRYYTDASGDWGLKNGNWCHIPAICNL